MILMLGMIAFALDTGVIVLTKTQLQVAADSAALAAGAALGRPDESPYAIANSFAERHRAGGANVVLSDSDVQLGVWDTTQNPKFTPQASANDPYNAVRVTARRDNSTGANNLFFGRVFGADKMNVQASAVALANPRDICFVVDLSGSMSDDTEPWNTASINSNYPGLGTTMMQKVYTDLGLGTYPGTERYLADQTGLSGLPSTGGNSANRTYAVLTCNTGPLRINSNVSNANVPAMYRITSNSMSESDRKVRAYRWIIDKQIAVIMPNAKPAPNSSTYYNFWAEYLDFIIDPANVSSGTGSGGPNGTSRGTLPPSQASARITSYNNGNSSSSLNKVGYRTYLQFLMDMGRDETVGGIKNPLAADSPHATFHTEAVGNSSYSFPAAEQPTHSARRSMVAAMQVIKERNQAISDSAQRDRVSLVTFDTVAGTVLAQPLTVNYDATINKCLNLQAVNDATASTATETGLIFARQHLEDSAFARRNANKVVVLLTDGVANLKSSSNNTISAYRNSNPNDDFTGNNYNLDAALMQTDMLRGGDIKARVYSVALGNGVDAAFMNRLARMGGTAVDGNALMTGGDPSAYEAELKAIFEKIIFNAGCRLVQ
jgi:hypothetical protein